MGLVPEHAAGTACPFCSGNMLGFSKRNCGKEMSGNGYQSFSVNLGSVNVGKWQDDEMSVNLLVEIQ